MTGRRRNGKREKETKWKRIPYAKWGGQKGGVIKGERREEAKTVKRRGEEKLKRKGNGKGRGEKPPNRPSPE